MQLSTKLTAGHTGACSSGRAGHEEGHQQTNRTRLKDQMICPSSDGEDEKADDEDDEEMLRDLLGRDLDEVSVDHFGYETRSPTPETAASESHPALSTPDDKEVDHELWSAFQVSASEADGRLSLLQSLVTEFRGLLTTGAATPYKATEQHLHAEEAADEVLVTAPSCVHQEDNGAACDEMLVSGRVSLEPEAELQTGSPSGGCLDELCSLATRDHETFRAMDSLEAMLPRLDSAVKRGLGLCRATDDDDGTSIDVSVPTVERDATVTRRGAAGECNAVRDVQGRADRTSISRQAADDSTKSLKADEDQELSISRKYGRLEADDRIREQGPVEGADSPSFAVAPFLLSADALRTSVEVQDMQRRDVEHASRELALEMDRRMSEEEDLARRLLEAEQKAAEERRRRRAEEAEKIRLWRAAAAATSRLWRGHKARALYQQLRTEEEELRRLETVRLQQERDAMCREERLMFCFMRAESRLLEVERRKMAEEEHLTRLHVQALELARSRSAFESRLMGLEDSMAQRMREMEREAVAAEARRRIAEAEACERARMQAKGSLSATQNVRWREERVLVDEARRQQALAWSVVADDEDGSCVSDDTVAPPCFSSSSRDEDDSPHTGLDLRCLEDVCGRWMAWSRTAAALTSSHVNVPMPRKRGRSSADPAASRRGNVLTKDQLVLHGDVTKVEKIELCVEGLTDVSALQQCTRLKVLSLNVNRLEDLHGLAGLSHLSDLSVKDNSLKSLAGIETLVELEEVVLDINSVQSLDGVEQCRSLRVLSANSNCISEFPYFQPPISTSPDRTAQGTRDGHPLLKLSMYHNQITCLPSGALRPLTSLTSLDLGRNRLEDIDGSSLSQCSSLVKLVLSQNKLKLPPSPLHLPLLRELWLSGNIIQSLEPWADRGTDDASGLKGMWLPSLRSLFIQDNALTSSGLHPRSLCGSYGLERLEISFNHLQNLVEDVRTISSACPALLELQLHDNPLALDKGYTECLVGSFPSLQHYDGKVVTEERRWFALTKVAMSQGHLIVPMLRKLTSRNVQPSSVPESYTSVWRNAPRLLSCPSCGHAFASESVVSTEAPAVGDPATSTPNRSMMCPRCSSSFLGIDFARAATCHVDWTEVLGLHAHEVQNHRRSGKQLQGHARSRASLINAAARYLSAFSIHGCDEWVALENRLRAPASLSTSSFADLDSVALCEERRARAVVWDAIERWTKDRLRRLREQGQRLHDDICGPLAHSDTVPTMAWFEETVSACDDWRPPPQLKEGDELSRSTCSQTSPEHAAIAVQAWWRGFMVRHRHRRRRRRCWSSPAATQRTNDMAPQTQGRAVSAAATVVQSAFRGYHVRRALSAALESARYIDEDLDALESVDVDAFLDMPPELSMTWGARSTHRPSRSAHRASRHGVTRPAGHTTHVRDSVPATGVDMTSPPVHVLSASLQTELRPLQLHEAAREAASASGSGEHPGCGSLSDRQSLGQAAVESARAPSACLSPATRSEPGRQGPSQDRPSDGGQLSLLRDWGVQDGQLAQTMLRRHAKIRKRHGEIAARDNMQGADYRYRKFVQQAKPPPTERTEEKAHAFVVGPRARPSRKKAAPPRPAWSTPPVVNLGQGDSIH